MKTPITDELNMKFHEDESASFVDSYVGMRSLARQLELDRAELMEALERLVGYPQCPRAKVMAIDAISAARFKFTEQ